MNTAILSGLIIGVSVLNGISLGHMISARYKKFEWRALFTIGWWSIMSGHGTMLLFHKLNQQLSMVDWNSLKDMTLNTLGF